MWIERQMFAIVEKGYDEVIVMYDGRTESHEQQFFVK